MSIAFPCVLTELILSHHPHNLRKDEQQFQKASPFTFDYRIFAGTHVPDIEILSAKDPYGVGSSATAPEPAKENIFSELIDISKTLQDTIRIFSEKKGRLEKLISRCKKKKRKEMIKMMRL